MSGGPGAPLEIKPAAASAVTLVAGYISSVLITTIPWLHEHLTADQQQNLPILIAFALSALAGYLAPHTHRPDLVNDIPLPIPAPIPLPVPQPPPGTEPPVPAKA